MTIEFTGKEIQFVRTSIRILSALGWGTPEKGEGRYGKWEEEEFRALMKKLGVGWDKVNFLPPRRG